MSRILADVEALPADRQADLLQLATQTRRDRAAADKALTRWLVDIGWHMQKLLAAYPTAAQVLADLESSHRPERFPYQSRTAVADVLRCVLASDLGQAPPPGVMEILQGPVVDVLYGGELPLAPPR